MEQIIEVAKELDRQVTLLFIGFSFEEKMNDIRSAQEELRKCIAEYEGVSFYKKSITTTTNASGSISTTNINDLPIH